MRRSRLLFTVIFLLLCWSVQMTAATHYYVDFEGGSDESSGTSERSPWKHCPADTQATGKAAACELGAGDVVVFKGGVRYRGSITKSFSGDPENPIIYDGNTDGSFGEGPAIIDGSAALSDWTLCTSADEAGGNSEFANIWYTDIDYDGNWRGLSLLGSEMPMHVSQHPNPRDPMYQEHLGTFLRAQMPMRREGDRLMFSDPEHLSGKPDGYYTGMGLCFHGGHNMAIHVDVLDFDGETQTITTNSFTDMVSKGKLYEDGTVYSFFNSVKIIDQPGEYALQRIDEKTARVFAWPSEVRGGQPVDISRSNNNRGIALNDVEHVRVQGFSIERQGGPKAHGIIVNRSVGIEVVGCEISQVRGNAGFRANDSENISIADCYVHHLPGHTFGVFFRRCKNVEVIRTRIHKPTATALDFYTVTKGTVSQCEVSGFTGMHANGLTFYLGNRDLLIERNYVHSGNIPMTIKQAGNVIIRNNIFDGGNRNICIGMWSISDHEKGYWNGPILQNVGIYNNIFIGGNKDSDWKCGIFSNMQNQPDGLVVKNNIIDGVHGKLRGDYAHNIYTRAVGDAYMGEGSAVVTDLKQLFVDPEKGDFRPAEGSPAIGAGVQVEVEDDFEGRPRSSKPPTIGAYHSEE